MKKTIFLSIALVIIFSLSIAASAAVVDPITPQWDNIAAITSGINFDGTSGCAAGTIVGSNADELQGSLTVYKNINGSWRYVDRVYGGTTDRVLCLSIDFTAEVGAEYKAVFVVSAIKDGEYETVTKNAYRTCE